MSVMRVLVTGGAGFMGSNMVRFILKKYSDSLVINLDKLTYAGNRDNLKDIIDHPRHTFVQGDIAHGKTIEAVFRSYRPEYVINYAAETHVDRSILSPHDFIVTDVYGTFTLLESSRRHLIKKYIQISTDEVYGSVDDGEFHEASAFNPSSPYSASKAGADHLVRAYHHTFGVPTIVTHSCNFYGPYAHPEKLIPLAITNLLEGKKVPVYGDGTQVREWIYVADHCHAVDMILTSGTIGETYNIGTGERFTNLEVVKKILVSLGAGDEMIEYVKDRPGHDRRYALNSAKLRNQLLWKPTRSFERGLAATVRWYRDNSWWWKKIKTGTFKAYYQTHYGRISL